MPALYFYTKSATKVAVEHGSIRQLENAHESVHSIPLPNSFVIYASLTLTKKTIDCSR